MQPGEVIGPGGRPPEQTDKQAETATQPATVQVPEQPSAPESAPAVPAEPQKPTEFSADDTSSSEVSPHSHDPIHWTASEYVAHEKSVGWYLILGAAVITFAAIVFLLTKEVVSSVVIIIMGIAFGAFAARQPQELDYRLDNTALHVGGRSYPYAQFKSFTVVEEGPIHSIMLMPLQRFMPPLSVYYAPEDEDKIADALSGYLPYEDRKQDPVDRFMRKIRF